MFPSICPSIHHLIILIHPSFLGKSYLFHACQLFMLLYGFVLKRIICCLIWEELQWFMVHLGSWMVKIGFSLCHLRHFANGRNMLDEFRHTFSPFESSFITCSRLSWSRGDVTWALAKWLVCQFCTQMPVFSGNLNLKSSERAFFWWFGFIATNHALSFHTAQVLTLDHSRSVIDLEVAKGYCESNFRRYGWM